MPGYNCQQLALEAQDVSMRASLVAGATDRALAKSLTQKGLAVYHQL